jgi:hypothetical protein
LDAIAMIANQFINDQKSENVFGATRITVTVKDVQKIVISAVYQLSKAENIDALYTPQQTKKMFSGKLVTL